MDPEIKTDVELVAGVLALDAGATREMLQKAEAVARLIARRLPSSAEPDDFVNRALQHIWSNDWRPLRQWQKQAPLSHYFRSIFANLRTDFLRNRNRDRLKPGFFGPGDDGSAFPELQATPENEPDVEQLTRCLRRGLDLVTPLQRRCLELRFVHELPYQQIADELAVRIGTVGTNLLDAQRALLRRMTGACGELIAAMFSTRRGRR